MRWHGMGGTGAKRKSGPGEGGQGKGSTVSCGLGADVRAKELVLQLASWTLQTVNDSDRVALKSGSPRGWRMEAT